MEVCKQVFQSCDSNGYVSYRIELLGDYWQKYPNLSLKDLLFESEMYAARTTSLLMKGKSSNRGCTCQMY